MRWLALFVAVLGVGCGSSTGQVGREDNSTPDGAWSDLHHGAGGSPDAVGPDRHTTDLQIDMEHGEGQVQEGLQWEECPLVPGLEGSPKALCATTTVPLWHDRDDPRTLPSWIMRYSSGAPVTRQMWMLQGGPGASGLAYGPTMARLAQIDPGLELITLDHRGVGLSQRLSCPAQESRESDAGAAIIEAEWPECLHAVTSEWGEDLAAFSSIEAAKDVLLLSGLLRLEGVPVFVYGASYGTTLGHRVLQLARPEHHLAGVILDAPNWPDRTYDDYDSLWSLAGEAYLRDCANDADCSAHLGTDPVQFTRDLWTKVDAGHCSMLDSTSQDLRALLAWMLPYEVIRPFAVGIVYRIDRCTYSDVLAISSFYNAMFGEAGLLRFDSDERFSQVLLNNIIYSEDAPFGTKTPEELEEIKEDCLFCIGAGATPVTASSEWPKYEFPQHYRMWADTTIPVLLLAGEMDPFAPAQRLEESGVREAFSRPGQHVVVVGGGAHGALDHAPPSDGGVTCGESILFGFMDNPVAELDTSCLEPIGEPSYSLDPATTKAILNTESLWDN